jgi:hypothetical protein
VELTRVTHIGEIGSKDINHSTTWFWTATWGNVA